ncbi:uncharacterized protein B0T15DRAFT_544789 [Chaetomium strumarium]|uniref:Secreted protein n=1 Tax=Chaetomium strumarium TaxID=1170767 RepID=A0AAJ0GKY1_9PEZI|nr:hypothetical protein B0T15DRAFT_544789 [Chaetomium strumarium]
MCVLGLALMYPSLRLGLGLRLMLTSITSRFHHFSAFEMQAVHYRIGATVVEPMFDAVLAAKVSRSLRWLRPGGCGALLTPVTMTRLHEETEMKW